MKRRLKNMIVKKKIGKNNIMVEDEQLNNTEMVKTKLKKKKKNKKQRSNS